MGIGINFRLDNVPKDLVLIPKKSPDKTAEIPVYNLKESSGQEAQKNPKPLKISIQRKDIEKGNDILEAL